MSFYGLVDHPTDNLTVSISSNCFFRPFDADLSVDATARELSAPTLTYQRIHTHQSKVRMFNAYLVLFHFSKLFFVYFFLS